MYATSKLIAEARYLESWLKIFAGLTKRAAWERLTEGGKSYPALGTFYKHVRDFGGLQPYLIWSFKSDLKHAIKVGSIRDAELEELLAEYDRLWVPTEGPM